MVFRNDVQAIPDTRDYPLETMRAVAVFLLVSYHVVGSARHNGLEVDYPHMLRVYADYLIDIRMPFFAFIAGYVYGLRPIKPGQYRSFISGKIHRLYIPGCIAAALFALAATLQHSNSFARDSADFWQIFFFPYAHYWFLQAILVIFVVFGAFDALARGRYTLAVFVAALILYLVDPFIPGNLMSVNAAIYLLPFFLFGLLFIRNTNWTKAYAPLLILASGATVVATSTWNLWGLHETGKLSLARHDLQSLATGLSACALAMLTLPRIPRLEFLGPFAFTIYLYHVFATSGMRQALHEFGVTGIGINLVFGILAGLGAPVMLHLLADRYPLTRRYMLGKRR